MQLAIKSGLREEKGRKVVKGLLQTFSMSTTVAIGKTREKIINYSMTTDDDETLVANRAKRRFDFSKEIIICAINVIKC